MFIIKNDAGYNVFFLTWKGFWTTDIQNAFAFPCRASANRARRRAWKHPKDKTAIIAA